MWAPTPVGKPTTTVSASNGLSPSSVNRAVVPSTLLEVHGRVLPCGPVKHKTSRIAAGAVTVVWACSMGTGHSVPIAFQNSSS